VLETCRGPGLAEDGRSAPKSHDKQQPEANQARRTKPKV
jgi:hypothetical protein